MYFPERLEDTHLNQLSAAKKTCKKWASRQTFDPSCFVTALVGYIFLYNNNKQPLEYFCKQNLYFSNVNIDLHSWQKYLIIFGQNMAISTIVYASKQQQRVQQGTFKKGAPVRLSDVALKVPKNQTELRVQSNMRTLMWFLASYLE